MFDHYSKVWPLVKCLTTGRMFDHWSNDRGVGRSRVGELEAALGRAEAAAAAAEGERVALQVPDRAQERSSTSV